MNLLRIAILSLSFPTITISAENNGVTAGNKNLSSGSLAETIGTMDHGQKYKSPKPEPIPSGDGDSDEIELSTSDTVDHAMATEETTPEETTPGETTSGETTPGETTPGETTPGETTPGETTPGETTPGETTPGETTPGEIAPKVFASPSIVVGHDNWLLRNNYKNKLNKKHGLVVTDEDSSVSSMSKVFLSLKGISAHYAIAICEDLLDESWWLKECEIRGTEGSKNSDWEYEITKGR